VQHRDGRIVMDQDDVGVGELLRVRVARGDFGVRPVTAGAEDAPPKPPKASTRRTAARKTSSAPARKADSPRTPRAGKRPDTPPEPTGGGDAATP
jgi:exodeoxyribonuclease VII large subunit